MTKKKNAGQVNSGSLFAKYFGGKSLIKKECYLIFEEIERIKTAKAVQGSVSAQYNNAFSKMALSHLEKMLEVHAELQKNPRGKLNSKTNAEFNLQSIKEFLVFYTRNDTDLSKLKVMVEHGWLRIPLSSLEQQEVSTQNLNLLQAVIAGVVQNIKDQNGVIELDELIQMMSAVIKVRLMRKTPSPHYDSGFSRVKDGILFELMRWVYRTLPRPDLTKSDQERLHATLIYLYVYVQNQEHFQNMVSFGLI